MKIFSKANEKNGAAAATDSKRDVTISNEPKKRPDHVRAETADCTWKLPLTIDEQSNLAYAYERGIGGDEEEQVLGSFIERVYEESAEKLTVDIKPWAPGEVRMEAKCGHLFNGLKVVPYAEVGQVICEWVTKSQHRPELVADLVAAFPGEQE